MKHLFYFFLFVLLTSSCSTPIEKVSKLATPITATEAEYSKIDTNAHYEIDLVYPVIDGDFTPEVLNKINNTIAEKFNDFTNQNSFIEAHQNLPENFNSDHEEWLGVLQNTYGISQCDSIVTIWFSVYQYYLGAAHGFTINQSLRFNINTGRLLNVNDFFKTDPKSLQVIKSIINSNLPDSVCWGIEADSNIIKNIEDFVFSKDSITIKIDDYALCPYAFGLTSINYPISDFSEVLNTKEFKKCVDISVVHNEAEIATH